MEKDRLLEDACQTCLVSQDILNVSTKQNPPYEF